MTYISKIKFAKKHGFSPQYVSTLLRTGVLKEEENGLLNEEASDIALAEKRTKGYVDHETGTKIREVLLKVRLQNEIEKGKLLKFETAEKEKSLIPVEEVKATLFQQGRILREAFLNLPNRLSAALSMQDPQTIYNMLNEEIRTILSDISNEE